MITREQKIESLKNGMRALNSAFLPLLATLAVVAIVMSLYFGGMEYLLFKP